jgi:hypothetical protein
VNLEGAASLTAKQVAKVSPPVAAPSFGIKNIVAAPELQPDPSANYFQKQTTPKPVERPTEVTIEDPEPVNCEHHTVTVKPSTTPKTIIIQAESSFARESQLAPQPYLPPPESPSSAQTLSQPNKFFLPLQTPTRETSSTPKPFLETYPKASATFVQSENILPPYQDNLFKTTTLPPRPSSLKPEKPVFEGQAANPSESVIPVDNEVDNCKHSFHSFLCTPSSSSRSRRPFNSSKPKTIPSLTGDSTFDDPSRVLPPSAQSAFQSTTPKLITPLSTTTSRPVSTSTAPTDPKFFAEAAQNPVQVASLQDPKQPDICKDVFHSFLCQPIDTSRRKQKYGERYQSTSARRPVSSASLKGDSSFVQPSKLLPNLKELYTTARPIEVSSTSFLPHVTPKISISSQTPSILCNHSKPSPTEIRPYVTAPNTPSPIPIPQPDSAFVQPVGLPYSKTPSTTIRPTPHVSEAPILNVPAAQTQDISIAKPDPNQEHSHHHSHDHGHGHDHHGIDICKDPFHSFLCTPVFPSKRKRPTGELPSRFRNPVPPKLVGASSFIQPTQLRPSDTKTLTIRPPIITTKNSIPPTEKPCFSKEKDVQPQPAQTANTKLITQPAIRNDSKSEDSCKNIFHSACGKNKLTSKAPQVHNPPLPYSNLKSESSFVNPSKASISLTANTQGTENQASVLGYVYPKPSLTQQIVTSLPTSTQHPGYVYNSPSKPLTYQASQLRGDSTFVQPFKQIPPINLKNQGTNNQELLIGFNEPAGYNYQKPSNTPQYPSSTTTRTHSTTESIFGQDTGTHESAQGYNYPKPSPDQQIVTQRPPDFGHTTYTPPGYNYPTPKKQLQYPEPLNVPLTSSLIGAGSNTESRQVLPSFSREKGDENEKVTQVPRYDNPYPTFAEPVNQPRPFAKIGTTTDPKPPCEHSLPKRTPSQTLKPLALPSPAEYVRGPTGAASVLAGSNEVPNKCNHPFLGYVCKRSSDGQVYKNK